LPSEEKQKKKTLGKAKESVKRDPTLCHRSDSPPVQRRRFGTNGSRQKTRKKAKKKPEKTAKKEVSQKKEGKDHELKTLKGMPRVGGTARSEGDESCLPTQKENGEEERPQIQSAGCKKPQIGHNTGWKTGAAPREKKKVCHHFLDQIEGGQKVQKKKERKHILKVPTVECRTASAGLPTKKPREKSMDH